MIGKHTVEIQNRAVRFKFDIERNVSIIRGDSATGKTTLIGMVADYQSQGAASGVQLVCDKKCVAMVGLGDTWQDYLKRTKDSIVFIDEGEKYVSQKEFAKYIKKTDNYYVIATRNNLYDIPYSVDAIYEVKKSGKYGRLKKTYNSLKKMYGNNLKNEYKLVDNDVIVVEDSKSGFQFFKKVGDDKNVDCISSKGKSNVFSVVSGISDSKCLVVADGAAFGPEMGNVYGLTHKRSINLFLPESFEWLILNSGVINDPDVKRVLSNPYDYIEPQQFFSWEQFFTDYLVRVSKDKQYAYNKAKINQYYLSERNVKRILGEYFSDFKL